MVVTAVAAPVLAVLALAAQEPVQVRVSVRVSVRVALARATDGHGRNP